jgi:hypothetical protein
MLWLVWHCCQLQSAGVRNGGLKKQIVLKYALDQLLEYDPVELAVASSVRRKWNPDVQV